MLFKNNSMFSSMAQLVARRAHNLWHPEVTRSRRVAATFYFYFNFHHLYPLDRIVCEVRSDRLGESSTLKKKA